MGTKRKIEIEKRETPQQRSVACTKRRRTVFKKATELCLLAGANVAVFVTSPAENSDLVYSFSGYSPASEIVECFLNDKVPPPPKIISSQGFYWEDPNLYTHCDDVTELNIIEDRLLRLKKDLMECLIKKEKGNQFFSFDPSLNPSNSDEIRGESCPQIVSSGQQNPSSSFEENDDEISSQLSFDPSPSLYSLDDIFGGSSSQIQDESSSSFENNSLTLSELMKEEPMMSCLSGYDEESSFWDNLITKTLTTLTQTQPTKETITLESFSVMKKSNLFQFVSVHSFD